MKISVRRAEGIVKESLLAGYRELQKAGEDAKRAGGEQVDVTTKGDIIVGDAVLSYLRSLGLPFAVYTEEKGAAETGKGASYSVVFDDIDGTLNFKFGRGMLPHGTILGVFEGNDPTFDSCLASGFLEYVSGHLFYAVRDGGAWMTEKFAEGGRNTARINTSGRTRMHSAGPLKISLDMYSFGALAPRFAEYSTEHWLGDSRCAAAHIIQVASGGSDIWVTADNFYNPAKKKTAEELGPGYLLLKEAGGVLVDWAGRDLGTQRVGMAEGSTFNVVAAASQQLADEFLSSMMTKPEIRSYVDAHYRT